MDALHEVRSAVISTVRLLRIIPIAIASIIVSGWGLRFLVQPGFWFALIIVLMVGGLLLHRLGRSI